MSSVTISTKEAPILIMDILKAGLVPFVTSSPGIGKSSIAKQIAASNDLKVIDMRLSQCDPSDMLGFPSINADKTKAGYVPMSTFPIKGDPLPIKTPAILDEAGRTTTPPVRYKGWLLLMDEFNSAPMSVQAAAYKVVLDKQVGEFDLHEKVAVMAAGNLASDKAIVNRLSTAMQSRLIHLEIELNFKDWLEWANVNDIDFRIQAFINFKPELLHKFNPDHNDKTFACPRTWEFVSKIIKGWSEIFEDKIAILAGTVSEGVAREFMGFSQIFQELPTIQEMLLRPEKVVIGEEPSINYAITGLIANHFDEKNAPQLIKVINRMPIEFQIICLSSALKKDTNLIKLDGVRKWVQVNAQELL